MKGRPPRIKPKTAYEVRRYLTLVQVLAISDRETRVRGICTLAEEWLGMPDTDYAYMTVESLVNSLAAHVIKYHKDEA